MIYLAQAADFSDSAPAESVAIGLSVCSRPNVHGQLRFTCTGPTVMVRVVCNYSAGTNPSKIAAWVDGAFSATIQPTTTLAWYTLTIPAGSHLVELQAGQQSSPSFPTVAGSWPDAVSAPDLVVLPRVTAAKWLVIEADSIGDGEPTNPGGEDWVTLVRAAVASSGWRVACYSYGFRALWDETDHTSVAARLDRMCPGGTQIRVVNQLGTNDYGIPRQAAAAYGTMYAARIAACVAKFGARLDKYLVVTPFTREIETANGLGSTLPDYRAQGVAQVGGKVSSIDGTSITLLAGDYNDSPRLHPNTSGHAKIGAALAPLLIA